MEEIYKQNVQIVYHYLLALCKDENLAEDLTQETFLRAFQALERFDGSCKCLVQFFVSLHFYESYL